MFSISGHIAAFREGYAGAAGTDACAVLTEIPEGGEGWDWWEGRGLVGEGGNWWERAGIGVRWWECVFEGARISAI